jgi:transposase
VRSYLEQRDPEFEPKMAEILCVYRQVAMLQAEGEKSGGQDGGDGGTLAIVSYGEKPGIQAIATTAPDRPPLPGTSPTVMRDHEYKRHGTLTLMAGIDLLTGHVHALVKERHRSREFIEFLQLLDAAYPAIEVVLDNHSAHVSRETTSWPTAQPIGRFAFTFTPTHGSWLNLIEGFFSKLARSVLRHIRVTSKHEETYAGKPVGVLVRSGEELEGVLARNPFVDKPGNRTVVLFVDEPLSPAALEDIKGRKQEELRIGLREIFIFYSCGMANSRLRIPAAKNGTARNMNTVAKLVEMARTV